MIFERQSLFRKQGETWREELALEPDRMCWLLLDPLFLFRWPGSGVIIVAAVGASLHGCVGGLWVV